MSTDSQAKAPNFGELFIKSKGQPIEHAGRQLAMVERFPAKLGQRFRVTIESTKSPHPQGVGIFEGVEVFGARERRAVVWEYMSLTPDERGKKPSDLPFSFVVTCRNKREYLSFYNMTEYKGRQEWWHGGSCMTTVQGGPRRIEHKKEKAESLKDSALVREKGLEPSRITTPEPKTRVNEQEAAPAHGNGLAGAQDGAGSDVLAQASGAEVGQETDVEVALAEALRLAAAAGQWDVVVTLGRELGERRRSRVAAGVVSISDIRSRSRARR